MDSSRSVLRRTQDVTNWAEALGPVETIQRGGGRALPTLLWSELQQFDHRFGKTFRRFPRFTGSANGRGQSLCHRGCRHNRQPGRKRLEDFVLKPARQVQRRY